MFAVVVCLLALQSCTMSHYSVKKYSDIKFEGKKTSIDSLININGFYLADNDALVTGGENRMFFNDGSYCSFFIGDSIPMDEVKANLKDTILTLTATHTIRGVWLTLSCYE